MSVYLTYLTRIFSLVLVLLSLRVYIIRAAKSMTRSPDEDDDDDDDRKKQTREEKKDQQISKIFFNFVDFLRTTIPKLCSFLVFWPSVLVKQQRTFFRAGEERATVFISRMMCPLKSERRS